MVSVCKKCGRELVDGEKYCGTCGLKVSASKTNAKEGLLNLLDLIRNPITSLRECATVNIVTSGIILLYSLIYMFLTLFTSSGLKYLISTKNMILTSLELFLVLICLIAIMGLATFLISKFCYKKKVSYISITNMFLGSRFVLLVWGLVVIVFNLLNVGIWASLLIGIFMLVLSIVLDTEGIKSVAGLDTMQTLITYIGASVVVSIIACIVIRLLFI